MGMSSVQCVSMKERTQSTIDPDASMTNIKLANLELTNTEVKIGNLGTKTVSCHNTLASGTPEINITTSNIGNTRSQE